MDWLMGKARGVSKGLMMNAGSAMNATSPTEVVPAYQSQPTAVQNVPQSTSQPQQLADFDSKTNTGTTREIFISDNSRSASPVNKLSVSGTGQTQPLSGQRSSPLGKLSPSFIMKPASIHVDTTVVEVPVFAQDRYVRQQLSLSDKSVSANFTDLVEPFPSMDTNEWLAAHAIALFENLSTIFDAIHELCTCPHLLPGHVNSCSSTSSHSPIDVLDEDRGKKGKTVNACHNTTSNSARQAIDSALSSCHDLIQSARIFPVRNGEPFPNDLPVYVTLICKNLLICIIHIYLAHFHHLEQLDLISHMNTLAKHFFAFTLRFSLIEEKHFEPLFGFHRVLLTTSPPSTTTSS